MLRNGWPESSETAGRNGAKYPSAVRPVKSLRVDPIEMSHRSRKGCVDCLNQEVIVIVHETVRIDPHSPHLAGLAKQIQKTLPILIVKKDLLSGGAPRSEEHTSELQSPMY